MKYLIIFSMMLVSCTTNDVSEIDNSTLMRCTPEGAVFIDTIKCNGNCTNWIEWKFRNECYISLGLCGYSAVVTKIDCEVKNEK